MFWTKKICAKKMIKIYLLLTLAVCTSFCQDGCIQKTYSRISEQSKKYFSNDRKYCNWKTTSISNPECDEYKDLVSRTTRNWGTPLRRNNCPIKGYECGSVGTTGLIVGGRPAKFGEFPHMAGEFKMSNHLSFGFIYIFLISNRLVPWR